MDNVIFNIKQQVSKCSFISITLAFAAFFSLQPYFIWNHRNIYFGLIQSLLILSYLYSGIYKNIKKSDLFFAILFCIFPIYITALYTVDQSHKTWFLLVPISFILFTLPIIEKIKAVKLFSMLFAISLVPSIILWSLMLLNMKIPFTKIESFSQFKLKEHIYYLSYLGSVFQSNTINILPSGGKMARLVGMYDEPGTLGTFAVLFLTFNKFNFKRKWDSIIIFIGGVLSFSLAFYILALIVNILLKKFRTVFLLLLLLIISFLFPYSPLHTKPLPPSFIENTEAPTNFISYYSAKFDNRSNKEMKLLFRKYSSGDIKTIFFGIASDANSVYDGYSSSWLVILTNYGLFGFLYLVIFLCVYAVYSAKNSKFKFDSYVFLIIFLINIYQRPFVWIPSYMLIFVGAMAYFSYKQQDQELIL